jgi:hypothetical protein
MQNYQLPSGSSAKTNTHYYDGQLLDEQSMMAEELQNIKKFTNNCKKMTVHNFIQDIISVNIPEKNYISVNNLNVVFSSWNQTSNFDHTNDISKDDVLYILAIEWNALKFSKPELTKDFASEFFLQFMDMQSGGCPQGRVIRLFQIASAYFGMYSLNTFELIG